MQFEKNLRQAERKELEQRIQERTKELEVANKELEAFAYSVSHDLRTPLRSIDGFSHILLEDYKDKLDEQGQIFLNKICNGTRHMSFLIEDMLKLSQVTRSEINIRKINLSALAENVADYLKSTDSDRKVAFSIQDQIFVNADKRLMQIALENLLGNAWKFTSKNPSATIEFGVLHKNQKDVYYVRDDGAGFNMNYAQKLFGAFQRLHDSAEFHGTGIGLATVERLIQRHGGTIWAEGEVEKGAVFYFTIA
jgi:light-regulated signal transduction histidine kinase (bacteriophytochrome)